MMRDEVVSRRAWATDKEFLDLLSAANLVPGPSSTELALHIGFRKGGWLGLGLAGVCFILPAASIVAFTAWLYVLYGHLPQVEGILYGIKPVVVAIVLSALVNLSRTAIRSYALALIMGLGVIAASLGLHQLLILIVSGLVSALIHAIGTRRSVHAAMLLDASLLHRGAMRLPLKPFALATPFSLVQVLFVFLKIGSVVFGSGYVLLAFLQSDLVSRLHWLTDKKLLDAVAIGQVTPGPVFTTATFIGFLLGGIKGAIVATVAIFLPGFAFVSASGPFIARIRRSPTAAAAIDGVTAGSLALIAWVLPILSRAALFDWFTVALAFLAAVILFSTRINAAWLILWAAVLGALVHTGG